MDDDSGTYERTARTLLESLPYMRRFSGEIVVIKYGGHAMVDDTLKHSFARNVALLKYAGVRPVIVHGGGPQIGNMLKKLHIDSSFHKGLRITDDVTMDVVEMVLAGRVNKEIVGLLNLAGARAVGLSGKDGRLLEAEKLELPADGDRPGNSVDLGRVGRVVRVDTELLRTLSGAGYIPVIAPTGVDAENGTYNINADDAAAAVAAAVRAKRLLLLTDVPGVLDKNGALLRSLTAREVHGLIAGSVISGGMIPKVECCLEALSGGVEKAMIVDGRVENCVLLELFTDAGIGSEITADVSGAADFFP
ncbi:MAG: acetylglutamate kinase [Desulfovibrio sp.]|jgi:acetylglutamate kinase|nr:acetylglutamate kinase [Desulfovibrio sp.]